MRNSGGGVVLDFRGKSGKHHRIPIDDHRVVSVIRRCLDLPGEVLFQYQDGEEIRSITAADVNAYLKEISGAESRARTSAPGAAPCTPRAISRRERAEREPRNRAHVREAMKAARTRSAIRPRFAARATSIRASSSASRTGVVADPVPVRGLRADERGACPAGPGRLRSPSSSRRPAGRCARRRSGAASLLLEVPRGSFRVLQENSSATMNAPTIANTIATFTAVPTSRPIQVATPTFPARRGRAAR